MRRRSVPFWFELLLAVVLALAWRRLGLDGDAAPVVQLAFWGWFVIIAQAVWTGIQAVGQASLITLTWMVNALAATARVLGNGLWSIGKVVQKGLLEAWQFLRRTYDVILKPAWLKFWRFVDWAKRTLDDFFRPIFRFLRFVRDDLLKLYDKWVRPILDSIGVARKILGVFKALGLDWAKALDAKLAGLEAAIDRPFRLLLQKINEVQNFVNRIATLDGLFQRLALVRSIERDIRYVSRAFVNWHVAPLTDSEIAEAQARMKTRSMADVQRDTEAALVGRSGPYEAWAVEMSATIKGYLR